MKKLIALLLVMAMLLGLQPVTLCELEHKVGETVYALGNSQGLESTFSDGIIAYSKRESGGVTYVQHSAPISGGNSGGPLINAYGEVIGINTLTLRDSQNLNFAVCIAELKNLDYSEPVTLSQLYNAENNAYKRLADYVLAYGEQSEGDYYLTLREGRSSTLGVNCELFVIYTPADGELLICFGAQRSDYVCILLDENVSGAYEWAYFNVDDDEMSGTIHANTFAENVLLDYDYHNFTNNSRLFAARELASRLVYGLCINLTDGLTDIGLTAADLGFVNF